MTPEISVVVPFFNEAGNVLPLFAELMPILRSTGRAFEVLAVDDGSIDGTRQELQQAAAQHAGVRIVRLETNAGQTAAFAAGFERVRGDLVVTMDGDLQIDPADIPRLIERIEVGDVDLVYGWRKHRADSLGKRLSTRVGNGVRNWLTKDRIADTGCPLKVFKREVVRRFKLFNGMHRFFITLAHMDGFRSAEVIVNHRHRHSGRSKYGIRNRALRGLRDCLAIRWMMQRHLRYRVADEPSQAVGPGDPHEGPAARAAQGSAASPDRRDDERSAAASPSE